MAQLDIELSHPGRYLKRTKVRFGIMDARFFCYTRPVRAVSGMTGLAALARPYMDLQYIAYSRG
jgi:hypothetical protein